MIMELFGIDVNDQLSASDGISRYGHYVRARIPGGFAECWDGTFESRLAERFAVLAWYTATSPVMAPPYAHWRPPVMSARFGPDPDGDTGGLTGTVEITSPWPQALGRGQVGGRSWQSWPREHSFGTGADYAREPSGGEVSRGGYFALATLRLVFPVPAALLPAAPVAGHLRGEVEDRAREAVAVLVVELNRVTGPVVAALEQS